MFNATEQIVVFEPTEEHNNGREKKKNIKLAVALILAPRHLARGGLRHRFNALFSFATLHFYVTILPWRHARTPEYQQKNTNKSGLPRYSTDCSVQLLISITLEFGWHLRWGWTLGFGKSLIQIQQSFCVPLNVTISYTGNAHGAGDAIL